MQRLFIIPRSLMMTVVFTFCVSNAFAKEITISQENKSFKLYGAHIAEMDLKVGDIIYFANNDTGFHNIFSLSPIKTFDLGYFPQGESRPVLFNQAGLVEIECAIHPKMFLKVKVSP